MQNPRTCDQELENCLTPRRVALQGSRAQSYKSSNKSKQEQAAAPREWTSLKGKAQSERVPREQAMQEQVSKRWLKYPFKRSLSKNLRRRP